jgi:cytochrome c
VADRYRGNPDAVSYLKHKIRKGGSGNWGRVVMPAHSSGRLSDEDLDYIVNWILGLERKKK